MLITSICLLQLFSQLQPARGETTELLKSVGKRTQGESFDQIACSFNINITLSRVDFVSQTGSEVFAIVDCGITCKVLSKYQDVLRIVSPQHTSLGDYFVFNATHSDKTNGNYTCHGIPIPQVTSPPPSGNGDGDGDGDGDESQKTSAPLPDTDEASHDAGGSSNGLLALLIIPILGVIIVVVIILYRRGVIRIPCLRKTGGGEEEPRDVRSILGNLLQPLTRCWERIGDHWQSTQVHNGGSSRRRESNHSQDQEDPLEYKALLDQKEDKLSLHHGAAPGKFKSDLPDPVDVSFDDDRNDECKGDEVAIVKEQQPLLRDSYNSTKATQDENTCVEECHTLPQSTLSPNSTEAKDDNGDVEEHPTSLQSSLLSNSIKSTDDVELVVADLSAAASSVIDHTESEDDKTGHPSLTFTPKPRSAESETDKRSNIKEKRDYFQSFKNTPQHSDARVETKRGENESMKWQLKTARNTEGMEGNEKRKVEMALVNTKEKESSESKSETINNDYMKGQLTTDENKEDMGGNKEREDEKVNVEMEEKEIKKIKSGTENSEDTRQKQEQMEETMAAKVEQEHKEEAKIEVEHAQEVEGEAVRELKADTRAEIGQTNEEVEKRGDKDDDYETASDDSNSSRDAEGAVAVDRLDGASSSGQNLVYTDQSLPEQECSEGEKRQTIRRKLKGLSSRYSEYDDNNSLDV